MALTEYVLGFAFNTDMTEVLLMQKARPEWQKGFLNGVGGHVEDDEDPHHAMVREFNEETGIFIPPFAWHKYAIMRREGKGTRFLCHCFRAFCPQKHLSEIEFKPEPDQPLVIVRGSELMSRKCLSNVPWLVMMASDLNPKDGAGYELQAVIGNGGAK